MFQELRIVFFSWKMIGFSVGRLLAKMEGSPTTPVPNAMKPVGVICPLGGGGDGGPRRSSSSSSRSSSSSNNNNNNDNNHSLVVYSLYSRSLPLFRKLTIGDQPFM